MRDAHSKCIHVLGAVVSLWDYAKLRDPVGNIHGIEWHDYMGPVFCGKSGEPLKKQPGERHRVWDSFARWYDAGRQVDSDGYAVVPQRPA